MKNIKSIIVSLALVVALFSTIVTSTGCRTTSGGGSTDGTVTNVPTIYVDNSGLLIVSGVPVPPMLVGSTIGLAAAIGANEAMLSDTNSKAYFVAAKNIIDVAIANGNYNPTNMQEVLNTVEIPGLSSNTASRVKTIVLQALKNYDTYYSAINAQKLADASPYIVPILQGISDGFGSALASSVKTYSPAPVGAKVSLKQ